MIFDSVLLFIFTYGIYPLLVLLIFKFFKLLQYKPHKPGYAFANLFAYFSNYKYFMVRDKDFEVWKRMKRINNLLAITLYCLLFLWGISAATFLIFSSK